ncbi:hypothetical protein Tco_0793155, partial [Tanacetum coccineum]
GEDRLKLTDLMDMLTKLSKRVLDLEHTKTAQAQEITNLKLRLKKLEKKVGLRTHKFKRLYKVGVTRRVEYSNDESLGAQVDASKQGRSIADIDKDVEVSLVDETHAEMFDTDALIGNEVFVEDDMIEKDQDSTATTAPSTISKAKGITFRDAGESTTRIPISVSSSSIKDKGKAKIDEPEVPLKKKDQIALNEIMARNLEAQIQAELIEEERLARIKEEETNIASIESWDNTQAMMEKLFDNKMKRVNTFIPIDSEVMKSKEGAEESSKRTKDELESDKSKKSESSEKKAEGSRKKSIDEHEKAEKDNEAEMKKHMEVVQDDEEIAINAIPLATKPPIIVEYKIVKEGQKGFYHLMEELRENTFSVRIIEDAYEHIEKVIKIVDLFHVPNNTVDQLMLRVFPISLTGAESRWLRKEPTGLIKTWEDLKTMFLNKYYPPGRIAKKMEEINNFQQESDETLFQAWECFKELLMKCPQHYLTEMQEVILFYNGLDIPTR